MVKINKENERGRADYGWLKANYSFSFANYYNPKKLGFKDLLVINEDFVSPKAGFPTHPHKNMEILTIVLSGKLGHTDSMGNVKTLTPGKIQRMYAGQGVRHSEFNLSETETLNLLQIWVKPNQSNKPSEYEEKEFDFKEKINLLASPDGRDNSVKFYTNTEVFLLNLKDGEELNLSLDNKAAYFHVISGQFKISSEEINYGDSVEIDQIENMKIKSKKGGLILGFKFLT